jgi:hypothetical protein
MLQLGDARLVKGAHPPASAGMKRLSQSELQYTLCEVSPQGHVRLAAHGMSQSQGRSDDEHGLTALVEGELSAVRVRARRHALDLAGNFSSVAF